MASNSSIILTQLDFSEYKTSLKTYLTEHPESSLKDLYAAFNDKNKAAIRGIINSNLKNGYFVRVKKGVYK